MSGAFGESCVIWVRDSDNVRDRVKVRVTSVVLVQLGLGLETLLDIEAPDAGGRTRRILPVPVLCLTVLLCKLLCFSGFSSPADVKKSDRDVNKATRCKARLSKAMALGGKANSRSLDIRTKNFGLKAKAKA